VRTRARRIANRADLYDGGSDARSAGSGKVQAEHPRRPFVRVRHEFCWLLRAYPFGAGSILVACVAHADVRSAPGRSSSDDVDDRHRLDTAAYLICTQNRFVLSPGCGRNPA
jgi:hypothetical protein